MLCTDGVSLEWKHCRTLYGLVLLFAVISNTYFFKSIAGALPNILLQEKKKKTPNQNDNQHPLLFWSLPAAAWEKNASCWKSKGVTRGSRGSLEGNVTSSINPQVAWVWQPVISQGWFQVPKAAPWLCASVRSAVPFRSEQGAVQGSRAGQAVQHLGGLQGAPVCAAVAGGNIAEGKLTFWVMLKSLFVHSRVQRLQLCREWGAGTSNQMWLHENTNSSFLLSLGSFLTPAHTAGLWEQNTRGRSDTKEHFTQVLTNLGSGVRFISV